MKHSWTHTNILTVSPDINFYTVTFAGENIEIEPQDVEENNLINRPETPVRTDCTFAGWFMDNNTFLNEWDFDTDV